MYSLPGGVCQGSSLFVRRSLLILMTMPEGERRGPPFAHEHPAVIGLFLVRGFPGGTSGKELACQ